MDIRETGTLLAKIQAFTPNWNVDEAVILAWHEVLEPHDLQDCLDAVAVYFAQEARWIMPVHIKQHARVIEQSRWDHVDHYLIQLPGVPYEGIIVNAGEDAPKEAHGHLRRLISTGAMSPFGYTGYRDSHLKLNDFMRKGKPLAMTPFDNDQLRLAAKQGVTR